MKIKNLIPLLGLISGSFLSAQIVVEQWDFNDGTSLTTTSNAGTWNSSWNADLPGSSITGGSLVLDGDGGKIGEQATITAGPVLGGSDKYLFEVTFSGWNFTNVDAVDTWVLAIGIRDSSVAEQWLGRAYLRWDGTVDLRAQTNTDAASNPSQLVNVASDLPIDGTSTTKTVGIEFDFGTGLVRYLVDGTPTHSFTSANLVPTDMSLITISRFGAGTTWDDADGFVSIDSITLTQITSVPEPDVVTVDFTAAEGYSDGTLNNNVLGAWTVPNPVVWNVTDSAGTGLLAITPNGTFQKVTYAGAGAALTTNAYSSANVLILDYSADTLGVNLAPATNTLLARFEFQGGGVTGSWLRQLGNAENSLPGQFSLYLYSDLNGDNPQLGGGTLEAAALGLAHDGTNWTDAVSDPLQILHYMVYDDVSGTWTQTSILTNLTTGTVLDILEQTYAEADNSFRDSTNSYVINNGRLLDLANLTFKIDSVTISTIAEVPADILITDAIVNASNEFVIDFIGAPSTAYQVMKSSNLSGFSSLATPPGTTTNASGVGQVTVPASEMGDPKQFFRLVYAP